MPTVRITPAIPGKVRVAPQISHEAQQNDQVKNQRQVSIDTRAAVVHQHENQHREHADDGRAHAGADRIRTQRRPHSALFQILDSRRQRARIQNQRQIFGGLLGHAAPLMRP